MIQKLTFLTKSGVSFMKVNEKELYFEKITGAHIKRKLNKNKIHEYALMSYDIWQSTGT